MRLPASSQLLFPASPDLTKADGAGRHQLRQIRAAKNLTNPDPAAAARRSFPAAIGSEKFDKGRQDRVG